jgi:hypothetical protein
LHSFRVGELRGVTHDFSSFLAAQTIAVKQLNAVGFQGHREFRHSHLVRLLGYCCEDEERLLVYRFRADRCCCDSSPSVSFLQSYWLLATDF